VKNHERRERTRLALIVAAMECAQEVGYGRLRTADVSRRAGLSEGSLFRSFPTKLDLVTAAVEYAMAQHQERVVTEFVGLTVPLDFETALRLMWRLLSHPELVWTYEMSSAASTDAELRNAIAPILQAHSDAVDAFAIAALKHLSIPEHDVVKAFNVVTWTMQSLVVRDLGRGPSGHEESIIKYVLRAIDQVYGSAENNAVP
jgi:AcrR family transcriptional regulator